MSDYSKLTVVKLKELLKERGLPVAGKKAELVERLEENDQNIGEVDNEPEVEEKVLSDKAEEVEAIVETQTKQGTTLDEARQDQDEDGTLEDEHPLPTESMDMDLKDVLTDNTEISNDADKLPPVSEEEKREIPIPPTQIEAPPKVNLDDVQTMPAPELPASQMPRPSIESQQIDVSANEQQLPFKGDGSMEPVTRSTTMSSANTQELLEDSRKRKRRSQSPPISSKEVALKKAKAVDGSPRATLVQDGQEILPLPEPMDIENTDETSKTDPSDAVKPSGDNRFKNLLPIGESTKPETEKESVAEESDRATVPSRHAPTTCLYISNLMRPLQPEALRRHLRNMAKPPTSDETEEIGIFFLESTRRYSLASFSSVSAASRARSGLHDRVWPDESNRKALFVDFVPEDKAKELIAMEDENATKLRLERRRFEILYIDLDGDIAAEIHDADSPAATKYYDRVEPVQGSNNKHKPSMAAQSTLPPPPPREERGKNFKQLDELFPSTTAKPRLYYLPISSEIANKRLDILSRATERGNPRPDSRYSEEKHRYTFEDEVVVDKGPEFGFGRGGGGRGRGGFKGDYRGRGRGGGGSRGDYRGGAGIGYSERW